MTSSTKCCSVEFKAKWAVVPNYPYPEKLRRMQQINFCSNLLSLAKCLLNEDNFAGDIGARIFIHEAESFMECNLQ